ncbi:MAG: divergent PAP2 family protein [Parcubacteria group bacterium]|nr:divergent PAP2 family protein [Parcubacteria group bacterium]
MLDFPKILIISLFAGVLAQGIKFMLKVVKNGKVDWNDWDDYGGMPSAHTAFVASLCTAVALQEGVASTTFAITCIISAILIRDALGLRMYIEKHGKLISQLISKQPEEEKIKNYAKKLGSERIGHTPIEVIAGASLGVICAFLLFYFL